VDVSHDSSSAQLAALREGKLDVALVREHPADPAFDAVLAVEEDLGVVLAASRASELASPDGVRLHQLAGLDWVEFSRSEAPIVRRTWATWPASSRRRDLAVLVAALDLTTR
jgi:DNA-binding transcriptional LysR family regulator